jgi:holo-[acyl-carrier protein] synthase
MIVGVGLDLCDAKRLRRAMERPGFAERVFDAIEIRDCEARPQGYLRFAARFAAKEAFFKALGTGWGQGVGWKEVAVRSDGAGPPTLEVTGVARRKAAALGTRRTHLSLSHSGDYAVAVVVLEGGVRARKTGPRRGSAR